MNKQITQCRFNVAIDNGTTNTTVSGFPKNVNVSAGAYTYKPYYYTSQAYDEGITGRLRSQLGGYRFEAVLSWDRLINSQPLLDLLNNAYTTTSGEVRITFFPDATNTTVSEEVVISDSVWAANLESTMVRQPLSVTLVGKNVRDTIPSYYKI
jgi:hypothetical protein